MSLFSNFIDAFKVGNMPLMPNDEPTMDLNKSERVSEAKAIVEDPLSLVHALQYKDKPYSLSYDTLSKMANRNSVIASIISTRVNQISSFTQPARFTKDGVGFEITLRNPKVKPTDEQKETMLALESFIDNCGYQYNPSRDNFDAFIRKLVRDSLTYDQMCFEIVPDRLGRPSEMYAVDAASIRAAVTEPQEGNSYVTSTDTLATSDMQWVQVVNGQIVSEFTGFELAFAVRNPRTDINVQPYGYSELEVLVHQVTSHLWAEEYNSRYFSQGGTTKGILNLKGQNISKEQLEAFRRQWTAQISGMTGAWKTPVVSVDGLEYINVSQSNREMEYEMWMNYLINICCAVYQIDPAEINFPNRGGSAGGGGGGLGDGGIEDRLKNSKDKGLRPLLRFIESVMNRYVIRRFSKEFSFNFVGLNSESEAEKQAAMDKQIRSYRTINEVRKEHDLDPIEGGDIVLDATFTNYLIQKQQNDQMAQQGDGGQGDPNAPQDPNNPGDEGEDPNVQYGDGGEEGTQETSEQVQTQQEDDQISQSLDENL
jgi:hypothetical protein